MRGLKLAGCRQDFSSIASELREEFGVKDGRTKSLELV